MKNLFFVSVALGIFSGTTFSGNAQTSINLMRLSDDVTSIAKTSSHFEGITINSAPIGPEKPVVISSTTPANIKPSGIEFGSSIETCTALQFKYAQMLNVDVESLNNSTLYNFIEE